MELTALSSRSGRAIATFLNFHVSHDSTARFLRGGKNIFILQITRRCFQKKVKLFSSWLTVDEVFAKSSTRIFQHSLYCVTTEEMPHFKSLIATRHHIGMPPAS